MQYLSHLASVASPSHQKQSSWPPQNQQADGFYILFSPSPPHPHKTIFVRSTNLSLAYRLPFVITIPSVSELRHQIPNRPGEPRDRLLTADL